VSELLQLHGLSADYYNAGLPQEVRNRKQEEWLKDKTVTMACTNAFGMGIDKPEVRLVVHIDVPDCIENYYQEAGRAGRDGKKSYATLLYQNRDLEQLLALPETRYPPIEEIRRVYQSLMNYLQLPIHSGKEQYFDFDLVAFVARFKHDLLTVTAVLKTLEQEGHISFNEQVFLPSKVLFLARKQLVYEFEEAHPELEPLIKSLLRSYEGIFEVERTINEGMLAKMNRTDVIRIKQQLHELHSYRIIHYQPQKDSPQLYFHENRVAAEHLTINLENHLARKKECQLRVEAFHAYLTNATQCRSQLIAAYFGDNEVKECGICDNCLQKKKKLLGNENFNLLKEEILKKLQLSPLRFTELQALHETVHKEQLWQVIDFLQSEQIIQVNDQGAIELIP
jgi:ATP-dependent DNA helicase RecQ